MLKSRGIPPLATTALFAAISRDKPSPAPRSGAARLIFFLTVLFLTLFFALIAYSAWHDRERAMADARKSGIDLAKLLSEHVSRLIESADLVLTQAQGLEQRTHWGNPEDAAHLYAYLAESRQQLPHIANILVADAEGGLRATAVPGERTTVAARPFFLAHSGGGESRLYICDPERDPDTGELNFYLSRRQADSDGNLRGVIAVEIRGEYFNQLVHDLDSDYAPVIEF